MKSDSLTAQNKNLKISFFLAGFLDFLAISGVGYILAVWPFVAGDRFIIELLKIVAPLACGVSVFLGFLIWPAIRRRQDIIVIVTFLFVLITSFSLSCAMISNIYFDQSLALTYEVPVTSKYEKKLKEEDHFTSALYFLNPMGNSNTDLSSIRWNMIRLL